MFASINSVKAIKDALVSHGVISKVLPEFAVKKPNSLVIEYGGSHPVAMGNKLGIKDAQDMPVLKLVQDGLDKDALYTLCLTDPDAPSQSDNKWSEYCHYLETDIKLHQDSENLMSVSFNAGKVLVPYMGPAPPKDTGPHRYVWILSQQTENKEPSPIEDRPNWGFNKPGTGYHHYATLNQLDPIAVNFFYAENK